MTVARQSRLVWLQRSMRVLDRLATRRALRSSPPEHLRVGLEGEEAAYFFLRREGCTVVARRWTGGAIPGDLDLIAWQGTLLCFIEVKTRTAHDATPAEAAVDQHKRATLRRLAHAYIRQLPLETVPQVRFDVISVYLLPGQPPECTHFENAFGWNEGKSSH